MVMVRVIVVVMVRVVVVVMVRVVVVVVVRVTKAPALHNHLSRCQDTRVVRNSHEHCSSLDWHMCRVASQTRNLRLS